MQVRIESYMRPIEINRTKRNTNKYKTHSLQVLCNIESNIIPIEIPTETPINT